MSCGVGRRCILDPVLLWLWCRLAAIAPIQSLAWEPPYVAGAALKRQKDRKTERQTERKTDRQTDRKKERERHTTLMPDAIRTYPGKMPNKIVTNLKHKHIC